jgi:hydroxymethylglutaryl-CoA synthase
LIGNDDPIAEINATHSYTSDTPDFWRREGQSYPRHGGRFSGDPGYFKHVLGASRLLFEREGKKPADYDYAVFHQPNAKFPTRAAQILGFTKEQYLPGLVVPTVGNTYSGASLVGLAATLDIAEPGDRIFVCSYGSGSGSDAFDITVTDAITSAIDRSQAPTVAELQKNLRYLDYALYARHKGKIVMQE